MCISCTKCTHSQQPSEEDPDEGIKDLVEIALKKMVRLSRFFAFIVIV